MQHIETDSINKIEDLLPHNLSVEQAGWNLPPTAKRKIKVLHYYFWMYLDGGILFKDFKWFLKDSSETT